MAEGFVESFARPGGNVTGFSQLDPEICGKGLELFKESSRSLRRLAVLIDPKIPGRRAVRGMRETEWR